MSSIILFNFESNEIRFVGTAENPEWVAADICKALDLDDTSQAVSTLKPDEKGTSQVPDGSLIGSQMLTVNEAGLYRLIFKSRKPAAERMKKWVFSEILPSIRKTGNYSIAPAQPIAQLDSPKVMSQRDLMGYLSMIQQLESIDNPQLKTLLTQRLVEALDTAPKQPTSGVVPRLIATAARAYEMGYTAKEIGTGWGLNSFVKKLGHVPAGQAKYGERSIDTYVHTKNLDRAITEFFN